MIENRIINLFLASSSELKEDRKEFEIFINQKNKEFIKKNVFIRLEIWEDFLDSMSQTRLQDEYNKVIKECDIFVMLFFTKVAKYTLEEFETAFKQFKENNKPQIFTYFKDAPVKLSEHKIEVIYSLYNFQKKISDLGHFYTKYKSTEELKLHFTNQLTKLESKGFLSTHIKKNRHPKSQK